MIFDRLRLGAPGARVPPQTGHGDRGFYGHLSSSDKRDALDQMGDLFQDDGE
jgi:hypothetical protein